ncbi:DUF4652 domain-containing protein [Clostridium manihotivorum]|uniref:Uncharacterized protein n=1 Tax=Clostridium manihotivorum TaxID=2320868 RepID=A0A410DN89_9CLOT|nr:DUF4652 domain-containing protein [Clostridium manihotivorum]QAA30519.1 hypothetical protein C1I91_01920 [Clostridium manihotivorum]
MKKFLIKALVICCLLPITNAGVSAKAQEIRLNTSNSVTVNSQTYFEEINPENSIKSDWRTPLKKVGNTNYEASIVGKGEYADEEGPATVLVRDTLTNKYKEFKFIDRNNLEHPQVSALKVVDGKANTLFVIVGNAYGMGFQGNSIYSLNVQDGTSKMVTQTTGAAIAVIKDAKLINDNLLKAEVWIFDDQMINHIVDYNYYAV